MSKTSECRLIVEFSSVYFSTKAYGITTAVRAVQFFPKDRLVGERASTWAASHCSAAAVVVIVITVAVLVASIIRSKGPGNDFVDVAVQLSAQSIWHVNAVQLLHDCMYGLVCACMGLDVQAQAF